VTKEGGREWMGPGVHEVLKKHGLFREVGLVSKLGPGGGTGAKK